METRKYPPENWSSDRDSSYKRIRVFDPGGIEECMRPSQGRGHSLPKPVIPDHRLI